MQQSLTDFLTATAGVRAVLLDIVNDAPRVLEDPALASRHKIIQGAMAVVLSGYFESFLKSSAKEFVDQVAAKGKQFSSLPERLRQVHLEMGGDAFAPEKQE